MAAGRRRRKGDETGADSLALSLATAECVAAAAGKEQEGNGPIDCGEKKAMKDYQVMLCGSNLTQDLES